MKRELLQRRFVETASRILAEEGLAAVTTRRIGKEMHCNSANTYYYFRDLYELIAYASMESFTSYLNNVSVCCADASIALEAYRRSWKCLIESSVSMPQIYEKLMYGKHSDDLGRIFSGYLQLFPEKRENLDNSIVTNLTDDDFSVRDKRLVIGRCVEEGWFTAGDARILSELIMWLHKGLLQELNAERMTVEEIRLKFFEYMDRSIEAFKQK